MATLRREDLDVLLRETIGYPKRKIYFQPPESTKITYPCLIYEFGGLSTKHADDLPYFRAPYWEMTYITRDPDDEMIMKLSELPQCAMGRSFVADNLYHYPYTIYY